MTSSKLMHFGTSPIGTAVNSLIAGNHQIKKKLLNIFKILFGFCSFFKSVFRNFDGIRK